MTPEQREKLLGLAFGYALVSTIPFSLVYLLIADNVSQAFVYSGLTLLFIFALLRWRLTRL